MKTLWQLWCETWGVMAIFYIGWVVVEIRVSKRRQRKSSAESMSMGKELNELILRDTTTRQMRANVVLNLLMKRSGYPGPDIDRVMHYVDTGDDD